MGWVELLMEPRQVTSLYPGSPPLEAFGLLDLNLHAGSAKLVGDLSSLPDPLPHRWAGRGFSRAQCTISAIGLTECRIEGWPGVGFDAENCMLGRPIDLAIEAEGGEWTAPDGSRHPLIALRGDGEGLTFRFVSRHLDVRIAGYEPGPY